jgi:hypothetical protein
MRPADGSSDTLPCRRCKKLAKKRLSVGSVTFAHTPDGPSPQNTGASSVDHDLDVVIGRNAEQNLRTYQARSDHKRRVIAAESTTGDHLSALGDGDYFVMSEQQRVAAKKARLLNQDAMQRIQAWQRARKPLSPEAAS